ncbi:Protein of unknown function [Paraburkholderia tropica]|uniref:YhcG PDDEXK nuclease domain-containing protein n=1 Tax=Paraburkholderia tropica TaxID=92647 RepID=A0AAQ1GPU9_9BURK|nr:Protein of unknown function [Paraburkholderia tropica]
MRAGSAVTNLTERLPPPQSDLAREALKDPYIFDFVDLVEDAQERDIEQALTRHITRFLLELGAGFGFLATLLLTTSAIAFYGLSQLNEQLDNIARVNNTEARLANALRS